MSQGQTCCGGHDTSPPPRLGQPVADLGLVALSQLIEADAADQGLALTNREMDRPAVLLSCLGHDVEPLIEVSVRVGVGNLQRAVVDFPVADPLDASTLVGGPELGEGDLIADGDVHDGGVVLFGKLLSGTLAGHRPIATVRQSIPALRRTSHQSQRSDGRLPPPSAERE